MKFDTATAVEQIIWQMRLADYPRGLNRAKINDVANGVPPYSEEEERDNNVNVNVNDLNMTKITHDARRQFYNAFMNPEPMFMVNIDHGPVHQRAKWSQKITKAINKRMRKSRVFMEMRRGVFANTVLHGIGPSMWPDNERWCGYDLGIEDVLVPSNLLLTLENLPFVGIFRQYTYAQLWRMTHGPKVDGAWNMDLVNDCLKWVDEQTRMLLSASWPEVWMPEKMGERIKGDGGLFGSDATPTVDCYDFYFWDDSNGKSGIRRRIILDAWGQPGVGGVPTRETFAARKIKHGKGDFLFDSGDRTYGEKFDQIIHFQFTDCSAVAPFRYHTVRGMGFLLYAVCHLQNRLHCKFNDATFESLLQYFRVANPADMDRLTKVDLVDKGLIPEGLNFVPAADRWQVNDKLVTQALAYNRQTMSDNSSSFTQDFEFDQQSSEETATRTMAKVNASAALVGSMLSQAYNYESYRYNEICRRFCIPNSLDPDVRSFRNEVLHDEVPEEALQVERWEITPVRVIGQGNKTMQIAIADKLEAIRPTLDPEAQKRVDRLYIAANTDDYDLAEQLVPEQPHVSNSIHDSELAFGCLMSGSQVTPKPGLNAEEVAATIMRLMATKVQQIGQQGGVGTPQDVMGLTMAGQYAQSFIEMLAQDKREKPKVKVLADGLSKIMNEVRAMAQRQQQAAQKAAQQGGGNGQPDPEKMAKIQADMMASRAKIEQGKQSHAAKTAQRSLQFREQMRQKQQEHALKMQAEQQKHGLDIQTDLQEHAAQLIKTRAETREAVRNEQAKNKAKAAKKPSE